MMPSTPTINAEQRALNRKRFFWLGVLIIVIVAIKLVQYYVGANSADKAPPVPVVVAVAQSKDVPVYLSALGTVSPTSTVTVKTQINGQLLHVLFREGQMVKTGALLAEIDPRPYQAQLTQYQGQLARDSALLLNDQLNLKRYQKLWKENSVAKQTLDTQAAQVLQDEGTVKIDQGLVQNTLVNLAYCRITSPIDGRVGLSLVDAGNVVQVSDPNGIAVITTLQPITVIFTIPEDNVPQVLQQLNAGKTLTVLVYDRQQTTLLATGKLLTIDNQIDPTTGTVKLRAEFENKDNQLFPNQFVNTQLLVNTLHNAIIVPTAAIQHGAQGSFVYLLNKNHTVSVRSVVTGTTQGDNTVISSGVVSGQSVVIEGADSLTDGATVTLPGDTSVVGKTKHHHR